LLVVYVLTMFGSATLLFLIQPMFARMVLPLLGGSPAVWNTAVVFYQTLLLAGYAYAHWTTARFGIRRQSILHLIILFSTLLVLPITVPSNWVPPTDTSPIPWLLALLFTAVGLPFFVVSASSPLIQTWFAHTKHQTAQDPYFLYAASNVGSMIGLLSYPLFLEQRLRLRDQSWLWAGGYVIYLGLFLGCTFFVWRATKVPETQETASKADLKPLLSSEPEISFWRRFRWLLWATVPSSLMLSVTSYLSTDIASIPLFWIIPLTLYLLTFVLVFARKTIIPHLMMVRIFPVMLILLLIVINAQATRPMWLLFPIHLMTFFVVTMACHGALANDRPSAQALTEFYLWVSLGGALGGIFNALVAPLIFKTILEYPLIMIVAAFLPLRAEEISQIAQTRKLGWRSLGLRLDLGLPLLLGLLMLGIIQGVQMINMGLSSLKIALLFGLPAFICFSFARRPLRFGLGVTVMVFASMFYGGDQGQILYTGRSFFGVLRVYQDQAARYHTLTHGTTLHGMQSIVPGEERKSLSYYYATGPIGQFFATFSGPEAKQKIAVVGLGVGSLTCYSQPGQKWTFYEIDPAVEQVARDPRYFTFLRDCGPTAKVILGDARLSLEKVPSQAYDLLILDAYSSDSIPVHLITREALALYRAKLTPNGLLVFHISNHYLDLKPVLANLAQDAGLVCFVRDDILINPKEGAEGKFASQWAVMAHNVADLRGLAQDKRWQELKGQASNPLWTDDFASILSVFRPFRGFKSLD